LECNDRIGFEVIEYACGMIRHLGAESGLEKKKREIIFTILGILAFVLFLPVPKEPYHDGGTQPFRPPYYINITADYNYC